MLEKLRGKIWALEDRLTVREQIALATAGLCLFVSFAIAFGAAYVGRQEAARLIGWGRNTLTRKLRELDLE